MATAIADEENIFGVIARNDIKGEYIKVGLYNREYLDQILKIIREINPIDDIELGFVKNEDGTSAMLCISFENFTGLFVIAGKRDSGG